MKKKRITIALYLAKMNRSDKVTQGNATHDAVNTSTYFPASTEKTATQLALQTATDNLALANEAAKSGSHADIAAAESAELQFDQAMRNEGAYVQKIADADAINAETIILSAKLKVRKAPQKMVKPFPIQELGARVTGKGNSIKLYIKSTNPRGTQYEIVMTSTPDIDGSWVVTAFISAKRLEVDNLVNGTRYYFKVRAINSLGNSTYSDVISQIAA